MIFCANSLASHLRDTQKYDVSSSITHELVTVYHNLPGQSMYIYIYIYTSGGQKFMLLGADINLLGTVWSAADRIRKLI